MPSFDDRLKDRLERVARPAAPDVVGLFHDVAHRRARRTVIRRIQVVALVVVVLAGTTGTFLALGSRFKGSEPASPIDPGGTMAFRWAPGQASDQGEPQRKDLWAVAGDGSGLRPLFEVTSTEQPLVESVIASPDGARVAYLVRFVTGEQTGLDAVIVSNSDGSDPRIVATTADTTTVAGLPSMVWSPDGKRLAYPAFSGDLFADTNSVGLPYTDVGVANADGSGFERIDVPGGPVFSFAWAPDGNGLYVVRAADMSGPSDLYRMELDGNLSGPMTGLGTVSAVSVSPTDGRVAILAGQTPPAIAGTSPTGDIWVLDPSTETPSRITSGGEITSVAWSPDGSRLAATLGTWRIGAPGGTCWIDTMAPDGSDRVTLLTSPTRNACLSNLVWGPGLPLSFTPTPLTTPTPTPTPWPGDRVAGEDIGLGSPWCELGTLDGLDLLGDGTPSTAWTGYPADPEGTCPRIPGAANEKWRVAVDVTGDGLADAESGTNGGTCLYTGCSPLGASDLDGDGDQELVIHTNFSIIDHLYFSARRLDSGGFALDPILVADPGNPAAGIDPGAPLVTSAAGDAGYAGWIRCEGYPESPILVWTYVSSVVESDRPAEWHETKLQLLDDGSGPPMFHVVATNDFTLPPTEDPGLIRSEKPACGLDFNIWAPPN